MTSRGTSHFEVAANGLPVCHRSQSAVDATIDSPLKNKGEVQLAFAGFAASTPWPLSRSPPSFCRLSTALSSHARSPTCSCNMVGSACVQCNLAEGHSACH